MFQNKKVWLGAGLGFVVALAGAGFVIFNQHSSQHASLGAASLPGDDTTSQTASTNTSTTSQAGASLEATNSNSTSSQGQLNVGGQSLTGQNQASGSSSASQSNPFDPTTFAQYDKYKDSTSALMADAQNGDGATLEAGKTAVVYYRGWLTNGTLFDQSRTGSDGNLQPFSFTVGSHQVITGWEQGLVGMKAGGVRLLIIPPSVGYGTSGQGSIPPNSVLIFQVQLVAVQ